MHRSVQASIGNSKGANSRLSAVVVKFSFVLSYAPPPPSLSLSLSHPKHSSTSISTYRCRIDTIATKRIFAASDIFTRRALACREIYYGIAARIK